MNIEVKSGLYTKKEKDIETQHQFNYYTDLKMSDKMRFVNLATDLIVTDTSYNSIIEDLIFNFFIVYIFTDIELDHVINSANNINAMEDFLNNTNIVDIVCSNVDDKLIKSLHDAVDKNIAYRTGIHESKLNNALVDLVETITDKMSDININELMDCANIIDKSNLLDGITSENIVNAFVKSDAFDKIQGEHKKKSEKRDKIIQMNKVATEE